MAACRIINSPITGKEVTSQLWNELYAINQDEKLTDRQYRALFSKEFLEQNGNWVAGQPKTEVNTLGEPTLEVAQRFLQGLPEPEVYVPVVNEDQDKLFHAFEQRLQEFHVQKIEKEPTGETDEEPNSFYEVVVNGETKKARRVTEIAKAKNKARNGGRDYFADATAEQKEQWAHKAMSGTNGHKDLEQIINASLRGDGTVLPKSEIDLTSVTPNTNPSVFSLLRDYLLGTDTQEGLLYSFPVGTRFKTEQIVYSSKDNIAGTIDLMALKPDNTVEVLDWKFMGFDLEKNPDIPVQKRQQHAIQLGEYKKLLTTYGVKPASIKARTIPIHAQYSVIRRQEQGRLKSISVLEGITMGKIRMKDEDRTYLLSVTPEDQSTGNTKADDLIKSLKAWYKRLYSRKADDHSRELKLEELNTLSAAIRNLQTSLNFDPLADQAIAFQKNTDRLIEQYKNLPEDLSIPKEELDEFLSQLISATKVAENYAHLDKTFTSAYGKDDLTDKQKETLKKLKEVSSDTSFKQDELLNITKDIVARIAQREGVQNILSPEKELSGIVKDFRELGAQQPKVLQTFYSLFSRAKSKAKLKTDEQIQEFGKIYQAFAKWGEGKGKSLFELIANKDGHTLIAETSKELWTKLREAGKNKDKQWIKDNTDQAEYKRLYEEAFQRFEAEVKRTSDNDQENTRRLNNWKQKYDIENTRFFGWDNWIIKKTLKKENFHTPEYTELLKPQNKPALDMYNFIVGINKRAYTTGYLQGNKSLRFLPFIMGTTLQRIMGSETGSLKALKGSIADRFSVLADDDVKYSQIDEETGEQKRTIPKFFTTDMSREVRDENGKLVKKDYSELSHDLNRIIPLYLSALNEYEAAQDIEATAEALQIVEENKGHLEVDKLGNIITQGNTDTPREFKGNEKNTDILRQYIDDGLYGIKYDREAWADKLFSSMSEDKKLSAMKTIEQTNKLTQLKALGLKLVVAIPNYFGANMQGIINAGRLNTAKEFLKNEMKVVGSAFQGREGNILKGLIDYFVPLNEDLTKMASRRNAQSPLDKLKYWNTSDILMAGLSIPDKVIQMANALSILDNTMVENGELVNIREYLRKQPEWKNRYKAGNIREVEKSFNKRVKELQETRSLKKIAIFNKEGFLTIPGIERTSDTVAMYRNIILQSSKQITGQMSNESKRLYSRDIIKRSFMMFKNWIPQLVENRFGELKYNKSVDAWEYGRIRLMAKIIWSQGFKKIGLLRDVVTASPKGLEYLHQLWEEKREDFLRKNGRELSEELSEEQFYDLVRTALEQEAKELATLFSMMGLLFYAYAATPPEDEEDGTRNLYKMMARIAAKTSDEILFYYNPLSFESITRGTILPSIGILSDAGRVLKHSSRLMGGELMDNDKWIDSAHPLKATLNAFPVSNYFANELLPLIDPEMAKEMGIKVTDQARPGQ